MITLVSAGLLVPKKPWNIPLARRHLYLNYGLLGLASILADKGYSTRVVHGGFDDPGRCADTLFAGVGATRYPILLSLPSFQAVPWAAQFCKAVRRELPGVRIVAGGRWVVDRVGTWLRHRIPEIDLVVYGTAEGRVEDVLFPERWDSVSFTDRDERGQPEAPLQRFPRLRFPLVEDFRQFQPSLEVSRGCGMGCVFCVEAAVARSALRDPAEVVAALVAAAEDYGDLAIRPYLEASFFLPTTRWAQELACQTRAAGIGLQWRCETRVDVLKDEVLEPLAEAGLKVIDLGLESASHRQLSAMGKASNPRRYLERASRLIKRCADLGIWVKANYLMYAGESLDSFKESEDWLIEHKPWIKGISANPVVVYGADPAAGAYLKTLEGLGARPADPGSLLRDGFANLHISRSIDVDAAKELCLRLCRNMMTAIDYYDLKSFSYFPRSFGFQEFVTTVASGDPAEVPFEFDGPGGRA